eukprot:8742730-Pyramimonas_sp.AAC.1
MVPGGGDKVERRPCLEKCGGRDPSHPGKTSWGGKPALALAQDPAASNRARGPSARHGPQIARGGEILGIGPTVGPLPAAL